MKKIIFVLGTLALFTLFFACKVEDAGATADTGKTKYTVTIVTNGGDGITNTTPMVEEGGTLTLANPSKTGYVFKGWSTTNELKNLDFVSGVYKVDHDITIYAMFNKLYNVVIDTNGATPPTITKQVEAGTKVTLATTEIPTKTAYTLSGYKDGNSVAFDIATQVVNSDLNLTMQWTVDLNEVRRILTRNDSVNGEIWLDPIRASYYLFRLKSNDLNSYTVETSFLILASLLTSDTEIVSIPQGDTHYNTYVSKFSIPTAAQDTYITSISEWNFSAFNDTGEQSYVNIIEYLAPGTSGSTWLSSDKSKSYTFTKGAKKGDLNYSYTTGGITTKGTTTVLRSGVDKVIAKFDPPLVKNYFLSMVRSASDKEIVFGDSTTDSNAITFDRQ